MPTPLTQRDLRNNSGEIMRRLDRGEEFVVTRNGVPVAELTPVRPRELVAREVVLRAFHGLPAVDSQRLRTDVDAFVDQDSTPRG